MKNLYYALAVLLLFSFSMNAQTITGKEADRKISGAELIRLSDKSSVPEYIRFRLGKEINRSSVSTWLKTAFGLNEQTNLALLKAGNDNTGMTHYRYQQTFNNIPVEDAIYIVHAKGDKVVSMNGSFSDQINIESQPSLSESAALDKALAYMNADSYRWQSPLLEKEIKRTTGNKDATWFPKGTLTIVPSQTQGLSESFRLCYKFDIYAEKPLRREYVFVDAQTGEIIYTKNRIETANANGTAVTVYSGTQAITTDSTTSNNFSLNETGRGNGIQTLNLKATTNYGGAVDFTDADDYWNNVNAALDQYATDAHWGAEKTYDFYLQKFGRNSIDNNGFKLVNYVHYSTGYLNAFWDGQEMTFGDGSGSYTPLTTLDIVGHEISHGLTQNTSGLNGQGEAGALNEGFSDCMGASIRYFGEHPASIDWIIGDNIGGTPFRSMSNPKQYGNPDTYLGTNWDNVNQEVHKNSTILSHWFYLLTQGGSGTNDNGDSYSVTGIGIQEAEAICFRMNTVYFTPNVGYSDARTFSIEAAADLFGGCTNEVIQATNAWHAVGVGAAFIYSVTGDFAANITSACGVPVNINFNNTIINAGSFLWNFGDGDTSTTPDPVHTYNSYGTFTVTLIGNGSACGTDTVVKTAYIKLTDQSPVIDGNNVACPGSSAILTATGADTIKWYNSASGGSPLGTGPVFSTPSLTTTSTYYAESDIYPPPQQVGPADSTIGRGSYYTQNTERALIFSCFTPVKLISVVVYAQGTGNRTINLRDQANKIIQSKVVNISAGRSTVTLNFDIPVGTAMRLGCGNAPNLFRDSIGANYPFQIPGVISITDNSAHQSDNTQAIGYYYYFYDWHIQGAPCITARTPFTINVGNTAGFTYQTTGDSVKFTDGSANATSWFWNFGDGGTSGLQNPAHIYSAAGTYTVMLIAESNGCSDTVYKSVHIIETGLSAYPKNTFSLYPNPVKDELFINSSLTGKKVMTIYNTLGEKIQSCSLTVDKIEAIKLNALPAGIYFVKIEDEGGKWIGRFVKE